jgi:hypothetical protein
MVMSDSVWVRSYCFVALVEVVYIAIENLNEELYRSGSLHARVSHTQRSL